MDKRAARKWIVLSTAVLALAGGYIAYMAFSPPIADDDQWHPAGRVYTVQRSNMSIGISGVGTIKRSSNPQVVVGIKESEINKLKVGDKAQVWVKDLSSTLEGDVESISNRPKDINNQALYEVTVSLDGKSNVKDGMMGDMQIVLNNKQNVIVIPAQAVQTAKDGGKYVWVLPPNWAEKPGNKIKPIIREVRVGYMDERNAEIIHGLQEEEKIVVPASQK